MIKIVAQCDFCGHKWEADRFGDGALNKFKVHQLESKTICLTCAQKAGELLGQYLVRQG